MSSSSNSGKEISPHSGEVLEDVNERVKDVVDILNRETNRVRREMEALDEAAKKSNAHIMYWACVNLVSPKKKKKLGYSRPIAT